MATAGMFDLMRDLTGNPIVPNLQIADLTGSLYAALGILLALTSREKTGQGQHVDVAMTEGLVSLLALGLSFAYSGVTFPGRPDNNNPSQWFACYRLYETADGEYFSIGALEPHLWASVCRTLGCPEYAALQYDRSSQARIIAHLEKLFRSKTRAQWNEILSEPDNCVAPVMHVPELIDDPYLKFRKLIHQPQGGVPEPGIVPKLSLTPGDLRLPAYHFGQHTRQVLKELGYSGAEMEDLEDREVIWTAPTSCA
jgi:crotonobetainyl-CoA:carnitine CoA-transferase CaiB-like acyl-CoA transferase